VRSAAKHARYRILERTLIRSPYIPFRAAGNRPEASAAASVSPRTSAVRRQRRKLENAGELRLEVDERTEHLEEGFRIEASGW
jgi:hypothetical protein